MEFERRILRANTIEREIALTGCGVAIKTKIRNPMRIFSHWDTQFLGHVIDQGSKKVNILDENVSILHANKSGAF